MTGYTLNFVSPFDKEVWLFAIDENGEDLWPSQRIYGGARDEEGRCLKILDDGKIAITGSSRSWPATCAGKGSRFGLISGVFLKMKPGIKRLDAQLTVAVSFWSSSLRLPLTPG